MSAAPEVVDGVGRRVSVAAPPRRIVSLVPSTTETLHDLGLADRVVARTRYCVRPEPWVGTVPAVGGTKDPDLDRIAALAPDLVLVNHEENKPEHVADLERIAPVYCAYPRDVDGALADLATLGLLLRAEDAATRLVTEIARGRAEAVAAGAAAGPFRYAYLIWRRPYMSISRDTFIHAMLAEIGGENVFGASEARYPEVDVDALERARPDAVLLSSEPFPFEERHRAELGALAGRARLVDGQMLSWHGSRMGEAMGYLAALAAELPRV